MDISMLSDELLLSIFMFFLQLEIYNYVSLSKLAIVNKKFQKLVRDNKLWAYLFPYSKPNLKITYFLPDWYWYLRAIDLQEDPEGIHYGRYKGFIKVSTLTLIPDTYDEGDSDSINEYYFEVLGHERTISLFSNRDTVLFQVSKLGSRLELASDDLQ